MTTRVRKKHPSAVRNCAVSFAGVLDSGESLTGTPTFTSVPTGLTFASGQVNGSTLTIEGASVAAGKAVQFRVSGGTSGIKYQIEITCATNASPAQTLVEEVELLVLDN